MTLLDDDAARVETSQAVVERCGFSSRDEAEIVDFFGSVYDGARAWCSPGSEDPELDAEAACAPDLAADQVRCTLEYRLQVPRSTTSAPSSCRPAPSTWCGAGSSGPCGPGTSAC